MKVNLEKGFEIALKEAWKERESGIDFLLPSILLEVMLLSHLQTFQRSTPPSKDSRTEQKKLTIKNLLGGKLLIVKK